MIELAKINKLFQTFRVRPLAFCALSAASTLEPRFVPSIVELAKRDELVVGKEVIAMKDGHIANRCAAAWWPMKPSDTSSAARTCSCSAPAAQAQVQCSA